MSISKKLVTACVVLSLVVLCSVRVRAGQVTTFGWHSGVASLASTSITPAPTPNDNFVGKSPYEIFVTQKNYVAIGPVDITFDVINNGGTNEYHMREGVFNNTTLPWVGYHIELGYGFDAGFVKSTSGDGLDFDAPDYDSPTTFLPGGFTTFVATEDDILAGGGVMPYLAFAGDFHFNIDVPDGITQFTVRQSPIAGAVPEPCAGVLAAIGVGGFAMARRRRSA